MEPESSQYEHFWIGCSLIRSNLTENLLNMYEK